MAWVSCLAIIASSIDRVAKVVAEQVKGVSSLNLRAWMPKPSVQRRGAHLHRIHPASCTPF